MPGSAVFQRRQNTRVPDVVTIHLTLRRKARVKRFGDKPAAHDPNGGRQHAVQRRNPSVGSISAGRQIHVSALRDRMDSSISPACAMHANALRTDALERRLEMVLD